MTTKLKQKKYIYSIHNFAQPLHWEALSKKGIFRFGKIDAKRQKTNEYLNLEILHFKKSYVLGQIACERAKKNMERDVEKRHTQNSNFLVQKRSVRSHIGSILSFVYGCCCCILCGAVAVVSQFGRSPNAQPSLIKLIFFWSQTTPYLLPTKSQFFRFIHYHRSLKIIPIDCQ